MDQPRWRGCMSFFGFGIFAHPFITSLVSRVVVYGRHECDRNVRVIGVLVPGGIHHMFIACISWSSSWSSITGFCLFTNNEDLNTRGLLHQPSMLPALACWCSSPCFKAPLLHSFFNFSNLSEAALSKFSAPCLGKIDRNLTIRRCLKQFNMWYENHPVPNCRQNDKLNVN